MITVYVDILFATNLLMDYILLHFTGLICGKARVWRTLTGALFGALYATLVFFIKLPTIVTFLLQAVTAAVMVLFTFGLKRRPLVHMLSFFGISLLCGGVIFFIFTKGEALVVNGTVYFSAGMRRLIAGGILCFIILKAGVKLFEHLQDVRFSQVNITIYNKEKAVTCVALCDSGNSLSEPFTGLPVCILHRELYNKLSTGAERIYIIPYKTVSGERHVMTGFKPELFVIKDISGNTYMPQCIVGVTDTHIKKGMEAIISPCMLTDGKSYEKFNPTENLHNDQTPTSVE